MSRGFALTFVSRAKIASGVDNLGPALLRMDQQAQATQVRIAGKEGEGKRERERERQTKGRGDKGAGRGQGPHHCQQTHTSGHVHI